MSEIRSRCGLLNRSFVLGAVLLFTPIAASAASITIVGNANGALATATATTAFNSNTNTFSFTLTNTSPFNARITAVAFDLVDFDFDEGTSGLDGFAGANVWSFIFGDGNLGNVPQLSGPVLDFGWLTGNNFSGGSPNLGIAPGDSLSFSVWGDPLAGRTDAAIAKGMFVRFQRVGADGSGSDVGRMSTITTNATPVPEPASLMLFGSGLVAASARIRRRRNELKQS